MMGLGSMPHMGPCALPFVTALTLVVASEAAIAAPDGVRDALQLCTQLPDQTDQARSSLRDGEWQEVESAALGALYSAVAAFNFRASDPKFTVENAWFMAASILGNSALGDDQIGMELDAYTVAILGIAEGKPYCVLTGPTDLLAQLTQLDGYAPIGADRDDFVTKSSGSLANGYRFQSAAMNLPAVGELFAVTEFPADNRDQMFSMLAPIVVQIVSTEVSP